MKYSMMLHLIWVFTVCISTRIHILRQLPLPNIIYKHALYAKPEVHQEHRSLHLSRQYFLRQLGYRITFLDITQMVEVTRTRNEILMKNQHLESYDNNVTGSKNAWVIKCMNATRKFLQGVGWLAPDDVLFLRSSAYLQRWEVVRTRILRNCWRICLLLAILKLRGLSVFVEIVQRRQH